MALRTLSLLPNPKRRRRKIVKRRKSKRARQVKRRKLTAHGYLIQAMTKGGLFYLGDATKKARGKWVVPTSQARRFATLKAARQMCNEIAGDPVAAGARGFSWVQPVPA